MGLAEDEFGGVEEDKEGPKMQEESESLQFPLDQEQPSESDDSLFLKINLRPKPVKVHLYINK